jgi:UDP-glucose 4-epimerase
MSNKNVLISGAAGYIASFATRAFIKSGFNVTIVDNLSTGYAWNLNPQAEFIQAELTDLNDLQNKLSGKSFSGLIHFAAKALVGESVSNPDLYYDNNVFGSINLFKVARGLGVKKIIFSSTAAVYGEPKAELTEDHQKLPINPYGNSKLAVERYLQDSAFAYDQRAIVLRYFNACGALEDGSIGECHKPETHLIPLVVGAALGIYPELKVFGGDYPTPDGSAVRDYIHVEDLAAAHLLAFDSLDTRADGYFNVFNLGTGTGHSVLEVIKVAEAVMGKAVPHKIVDRRAGDPAILVANPSKIHKTLGWKAQKTDLKTTIEAVYKWMQTDPERFK